MTTATLTPPATEVADSDGIADLGQFRADREAKRKLAEQRAHEAIVLTARGAQPADLDDRLADAGMPLEEFEKNTETLIRRFNAVRAAAKVDATLPTIAEKLRAANVVREKLRAERDAWESREKELESELWDADSAHEMLAARHRETIRQCDEVLFSTAHRDIADRLTEIEQHRQTLIWDRNRLYQSGEPTTPIDIRRRDTELNRIESELASIEAERRQIEADRLDPVRGLKLGVPVPTAETQTATTFAWLKSTYGVKAVSHPNGQISHE